MTIMTFLHVICAIAAFGPALAFPMMLRSGIQASATQVQQLAKRIVTPALVGLAITGFGVAGMSNGAIPSSSLWLHLATLVIAVAVGVLWGLVIPAAGNAVAKEGEAAERAMRRLAPSIGVLHLCMAIGLYLMIWQPTA